MLQVSYLRDNTDVAVAGLRIRGIKNAEDQVKEVLRADARRRETQTQHDEVLARSNALAKQIGTLMKEGKKDEAEKTKGEAVRLKTEAAELSQKLSDAAGELRGLLYTLPNIPHANVPEGLGADDNKVIKEWGEKPDLVKGAQPHWDLIRKHDIIDFELGNKITGAGFPVYKGKGARLQRALISFFLDQAGKGGYREIQPPVLVNEDSGYGTGQLPDKEGQMYKVDLDNLYLIPTAEVPITNLYRDMVLTEKELPVRNVGYTLCFRREAGSWGSHVRGLNRLHQFDKVEIVQITRPEDSYKTLDEMCGHVENLIQKLNLPYRKVLLCAGDMGFNAAMTYDLEVYAAAQDRWLEVSSVSNFETFQANRLKLRCKGADGKPALLHTLNGSALALPRIVAALLENNQTSEGINIPEVLWDYTGFEKIP